MSNIIEVPRPPASAYNPDRPLEKNLLIKAQVEHFREAELQLPEDLRSGIEIAEIRTEGQAARYIRHVTRAIHRKGGRAPGKVQRAR